MSTVLTNGIIIPENGSRNWGGDLANNWNIIDVNVGYMNDVKSKITTLENSVTTLENSVAENTANIQINTSNISALQTSKQDVIEDLETIRSGASLGATAVQPSALSNYLPSSGGQITGNIENRSTGDGWKPGFEWFYNNERFAYIQAFTEEARSEKSLTIQADTHVNLTSQNLIFSVSRTVGGNTHQNALNFQYTTNGTFNFYSNTPANLGTSTNKWKTLNGINPGALSLPKYDQFVKLTFQLNAQIQATFTGFLQVKANVSSGAYLIVTINGLEVASVSPSANTGHILVPVTEDDQIFVTVTNGEYLGYGSLIIFKAQGNV